MQPRVPKYFVAAVGALVLAAAVSTAQITADSSSSSPARPRNVFEFDSDPPGATVYYDTTILGKTPLTVRDLAFGKHVIRIESEGFAHFVDTVVVRFGGKFKITPRLAKFGALEVLSVPSGVKVFLADTLAGYTPLQLNALTPGRTSIRLVDPVYKTWSYFVFIPEDATTKITVPLEKRFGYLSVNTNNPECLIRIDGENAGIGSVKDLQVLSGMRSLSLEDPATGQTATSWLHIGTEAPIEARADFGSTQFSPLIASCMIPGTGQFMDGARTRGSIIIFGYLFTGSFTLIESQIYKKRLDQYEEVRRQYNNYTGTIESDLIALRKSAQSLRQEALRARTITVVSAIVMGTIYAFNVYDILVHHMRGISVEILPSASMSHLGPKNVNVHAVLQLEIRP